jgi:porphobilinogen synthase
MESKFTHINIKKDDLILPYFIVAGRNQRQRIKAFPGIFRFSCDELIKDLAGARALGIRKVILFGLPDYKDNGGTAAYAQDNPVCAAIKKIKSEFPDVAVFADVCLCAYTTHGHCGIIKTQNTRHKTQSELVLDNSKTLDALTKIALLYARCGADYVAPSAMAKKQVLTIRKALDKNGYRKTKILGYSAKFASHFYGPFRSAFNSRPRFGDRRSYQLDYTDARAALKEIADDIREGADMVMVKPALSYLDVIHQAKRQFGFPLAAYNVSGEYSMVKYGVRAGLWDEEKIVPEIISSIKRAGADNIISYHAKDIARWLKG